MDGVSVADKILLLVSQSFAGVVAAEQERKVVFALHSCSAACSTTISY
jgi:hypothetical protein